MERHDVAVVGGGIAGLSCAFELQRAGRDVVLFEAAPEPGGNVRTDVVEGFRIEKGPHSVLASADAVFALAEELGLEDSLAQPRSEAEDRFIVRDGRLIKAPSGPWSFLTTPLLSFGAKVRLATEPFRGGTGADTDTAAQFFERRFGPEGATILAGAFISGVYAGDPKALSAPAAFPLFWRFEQETGSMIRGAMRHGKARRREAEAAGRTIRKGLFSFRGGLGTLTGALADQLGSRCRSGCEVTSIDEGAKGFLVHAEGAEVEAASVVVATPPEPTARLLAPLDGELSELVAGVPMAPIAVVALGYEGGAPEVPEGFGFLASRGQGIRTLGVLFPSRLFSDRAPEGGDLLMGYVGGVTDPEALDLSDEELTAVVTSDLETLTGLTTPPDLVRVTRHRQAIPQLVVGHLDRMAALEEGLARHQGLVLAGNYLTGVGLKDASASGLAAAARLE